MGLKQKQDVLAKLFTDSGFRSEFENAPNRTADAHGLTANEADELSSILPAAVAEYASALFSKRLRAIAKLLPLTCGRLGSDVSRSFYDYAANGSPDGPSKHYHDALGFCRYIESRAAEPHREAQAAARFERTRLQFFNERKRIAIARTDSISEHEAGKRIIRLPFRAERGASYSIWIRFGRRNWYFRF